MLAIRQLVHHMVLIIYQVNSERLGEDEARIYFH
jgi:hypothetical protein